MDDTAGFLIGQARTETLFLLHKTYYMTTTNFKGIYYSYAPRKKKK